jgi:hypothetical protein
MKAKTFPWLLMPNNTFQSIKEIKDFFFFFYLNAHKAKRKNINKSKPRKTSGLSAARKESL